MTPEYEILIEDVRKTVAPDGDDRITEVDLRHALNGEMRSIPRSEPDHRGVRRLLATLDVRADGLYADVGHGPVMIARRVI